MGSSPGFASTAADLSPKRLVALFRLGFPVATALKALTEPTTVTRRVIMQKARRHTFPRSRKTRGIVLRQLVGVWFQVLLTPLEGVLFIFRSRYLIHYRSPGST